jgi:hypothetical protein
MAVPCGNVQSALLHGVAVGRIDAALFNEMLNHVEFVLLTGKQETVPIGISGTTFMAMFQVIVKDAHVMVARMTTTDEIFGASSLTSKSKSGHDSSGIVADRCDHAGIRLLFLYFANYYLK